MHANREGQPAFRLRSVFISDVHLGSKDSRTAELLQFLASVEVDYLFLVGDIIDFWSLRKSFYWPQQHSEVVRAILGKAREGAQVIYIPGNHDEDLREFCGSVSATCRSGASTCIPRRMVASCW